MTGMCGRPLGNYCLSCHLDCDLFDEQEWQEIMDEAEIRGMEMEAYYHLHGHYPGQEEG